MSFPLTTFYQRLHLKGHSIHGWYMEFDGLLMKVISDNSKGSFQVLEGTEKHFLRVTNWDVLGLRRLLDGRKILVVR